MDISMAQDLAVRLRRACPVDSGALRLSISRAQGGGPVGHQEYVITIGNNQGKEINGSCATVEYAAVTNFARELKLRNIRTGVVTTYPNRNYHWVNTCIRNWIMDRQLDFVMKGEEETEYDIL